MIVHVNGTNTRTQVCVCAQYICSQWPQVGELSCRSWSYIKSSRFTEKGDRRSKDDDMMVWRKCMRSCGIDAKRMK